MRNEFNVVNNETSTKMISCETRLTIIVSVYICKKLIIDIIDNDNLKKKNNYPFYINKRAIALAGYLMRSFPCTRLSSTQVV